MTASANSSRLYTGHVPLTPVETLVAASAIAADLGERYELRGYLGRGAFATVWHAIDLIDERAVAVKRFEPGDAQDRNFYRELAALFRLSHPHIVQAINLLDGASTVGVRYLILEYCAGGSLRAAISRARRRTGLPFPLPRAAGIAAQLAAGLAAAHRQGIVHRDLKPENVLFAEATDPDRAHTGSSNSNSVESLSAANLGADSAVKLADFGLARLRREDPGFSGGGHRPGRLSGSPAYMAPEQFMGEAGRPADVYALGVILYELLHLELPFLGSPGELASAHFHETPEISDELPRVWRELLTELLNKNPAHRPTAEQLLVRLSALASHDRHASSVTVPVVVNQTPDAQSTPSHWTVVQPSTDPSSTDPLSAHQTSSVQRSVGDTPPPATFGVRAEIAVAADMTALLAVPNRELFLAVSHGGVQVLSVGESSGLEQRRFALGGGQRARLARGGGQRARLARGGRQLWLANEAGLSAWGPIPEAVTDPVLAVEPTSLLTNQAIDDVVPPVGTGTGECVYWLSDGKLWSLGWAHWPNPDRVRLVPGLQLPTAVAATATVLAVADGVSRPRLLFLGRADTQNDTRQRLAELPLPGPCWELHGTLGSGRLLARVLVDQRLVSYIVNAPVHGNDPSRQSLSLVALPDSGSLRAVALSPDGIPWGVDTDGRLVCWQIQSSSCGHESASCQVIGQFSFSSTHAAVGRFELAVGSRWWAFLHTVGDGTPGIIKFGCRPPTSGEQPSSCLLSSPSGGHAFDRTD